MNKYWIGGVVLVFTNSVLAFPCFVTVIKTACWKDYEVTVKVTDPATNRQWADASLPANGKLWARTQFECKPAQSLHFSAQFAPQIWQARANQVYPATRDWFLPEEITPEVTAWNINVCFPTDFDAVPAPLTTLDRCFCDAHAIPAIPDQN